MRSQALYSSDLEKRRAATLDRSGLRRHTRWLLAGLGGLLLTLSPGAVWAQVDRFDTTPAEHDSLFAYLSLGLSQPAQPADFTHGWENSLNLRLAFLYQFHPNWSVALAFEHTGFNGETLPTNPEIRLFTIIPSLAVSRPVSVATPYARLGIGYFSQGTRRMRVRDGAFQYAGVFRTFSWEQGLAVTGSVGLRVRAAHGVHPFAEVGYLAGRASSVTIGHRSWRAGVALSLGLFARMVDRDRTGMGDPPPTPRRR